MKNNYKEIRTYIGLSIILFFRIFGMFVSIPILNKYAKTLYGNNKLLVSISIGIYGLVQSILQIPLGFISDFIKRKLIIIFGLILLVIGSIINAITNNIWGFILGRIFQGTCAITSIIIALFFDLICEKNKLKYILFIGISFGLSFILSFILNPIIISVFGIRGIFWITSLLNFISIIIIIYVVPNPLIKINKFSKFKKISIYKKVLNKNLLKTYYSIFSLHAILSSNFIFIPILMKYHNISKIDQSKNYCFIFIISFLISFLLSIINKKNKNFKKIFLLSLIFLFISEIILFFLGKNKNLLFLGLQIFFISFSTLEILFPLIITKEYNINYKGISMGLYSSSQFLGLSFGGFFSSYFFNIKNICANFKFGVFVSFILLIVNYRFFKVYLKNFNFKLKNIFLKK